MKDIERKQQILFMKDVEKILGISSITLRRWWVAGYFPKPVKMNGSMLAWHHDVIHQWINENTKGEFNPPV